MSKRSKNYDLLLLLFVITILLVFLVDQSVAFGAGNIPSYAYLEDKAFRHGDIEDVLSEIAKKAGGGILGGIGAKKFGGLDIKRIYFGNWLRDYSFAFRFFFLQNEITFKLMLTEILNSYRQAMDVAGLSKLARQTIINLVMALGFLAHGYATDEFEVTEDRLGVYLPVEHIDNPKGYNEGKDARTVHPGLRGPIDPQELQIDPRTGMKNYIANENGTWDTSAACIRRTLLKCIEVGRRAKGGNADSYEAYRLLGTALHTLEDLTAHSNWCELSLRRLGHGQVFCHVGDSCQIDTPSGRAPPLVTGVFGAADFLHSLLGEASDHISEASVSDLTKAMNTARSSPGSDPSGDALRSLFFQIPSGGGKDLSREFDNLSEIRSRTAPNSGFDPAQMSPQELHSTLWKVLKFRDNVCKSIERTIEKIPGLSTLSEKISNAVNKFVFTTLEPYLKPIMQSATGTLHSGSAAVIDKQEQYEVFDNAYADDPTHSLLSKDHFALILNEPAGNLAKIIVKHAVKGVVQAWGSASVDPYQTVNKILEAFHHPYFVDGSSDVQREMGEYMRDWIGKMSSHDRDYVLAALTKDSVRNGRNKRRGHVNDQQQGCCGGHGSATFGQHMQGIVPNTQSNSFMGKISSQIPGYSQMQALGGGMGRDMNLNQAPIQNYGGGTNPHPTAIPDANRTSSFPTAGGGYPMNSTTGGGGMIMPDGECPLSPAEYGPGPGGFSIPEPMPSHSQVDPRSQSVSFPSASDGPPPIRHDSYPAPRGPDYRQNSYPNQGFPAPPVHSNTWSQNDSWNPASQPQPGYPNYEQRPPPPAAWGFPGDQQQNFPPNAWPHPSNQAPPPPGGGGYPYGGGY
ncbi:hypothetical protein PGT21_019588 [Puccinia graminis f. sp. tritici]|uniref:Heterokaryon incompatibility protein HET-C n=1 Tax=Puccinia graminis f. sp. tritici TaxID=56615 RepID=A0A5B0Q6A4_PUCGR|nr:hypothetical protein PGT21_019588 [Puccinia graminis f. sp. tritici]